PVPVPDGTTRVTGVRLVVARGRLGISGRAMQRGGPANDLEVAALSPKGGAVVTRTDQDGAFTLSGLIEGPYSLQFGAATHPLAVGRDVPSGSRDLRVEVPAVGRIEGSLKGFQSTPSVTAHDIPQIGAIVAGDTFVIDAIPEGEYRLYAEDIEGDWASASV